MLFQFKSDRFISHFQFTGLEDLLRLLSAYPSVNSECADGLAWAGRLVSGPMLSLVKHIQEQQKVQLTAENKRQVVEYVPRWVCVLECLHDDIMTWEYFPHYWPFVRGIHW